MDNADLRRLFSDERRYIQSLAVTQHPKPPARHRLRPFSDADNAIALGGKPTRRRLVDDAWSVDAIFRHRRGCFDCGHVLFVAEGKINIRNFLPICCTMASVQLFMECAERIFMS